MLGQRIHILGALPCQFPRRSLAFQQSFCRCSHFPQGPHSFLFLGVLALTVSFLLVLAALALTFAAATFALSIACHGVNVASCVLGCCLIGPLRVRCHCQFVQMSRRRWQAGHGKVNGVKLGTLTESTRDTLTHKVAVTGDQTNATTGEVEQRQGEHCANEAAGWCRSSTMCVTIKRSVNTPMFGRWALRTPCNN